MRRIGSSRRSQGRGRTAAARDLPEPPRQQRGAEEETQREAPPRAESYEVRAFTRRHSRRQSGCSAAILPFIFSTAPRPDAVAGIVQVDRRVRVRESDRGIAPAASHARLAAHAAGRGDVRLSWPLRRPRRQSAPEVSVAKRCPNTFTQLGLVHRCPPSATVLRTQGGQYGGFSGTSRAPLRPQA
jgi:hypothetical protein